MFTYEGPEPLEVALLGCGLLLTEAEGSGQLKPYCLSILILFSFSELVQITICDFFKCHIDFYLLYQPIVLFSHMLTLKSKSSVELIAHLSKRTSFSSMFLKIDFFESLCHSLLSE